MKRFCLVILLLLCCQEAHSSFIPTIPETTMQIARETEIKAAFEKPKSELIRVGIGDNSFKSYYFDETNIFATGEMTILNNDIELTKIPANTNVNIKSDQGMYLLTINDTNKTSINISGPIKFTCKNGWLGITNLKRAGKQALYRGAIEIVKYKETNKFHVINVIEVEDYLKGVVPNEMPVSFGLEALKAQSIAARNYVLSPRTKAYSAFDVVDSVASQVYFGANTEKELSTKAVNETEGIVAIYNWDLILAQYCSTAGGYTESFEYTFSDPQTKQFPSATKPYLIAKADMLSQQPLDSEEAAELFYTTKPDSYDIRSPYYRWQRTWTKNELQKELQQNMAAQSLTGFIHPVFRNGDKLDEITEIKVKQRGKSGKIIELELSTKTQTYHIFKELVIRRLFTHQGKTLPSANLVFKQTFDDNKNLVSITAYGGGFGHGVGMSQYGAGFMASELKLPYDTILKHYYTGIILSTKPIILSKQNNIISQSFYSKNKHAELVIDNKYKLSYFLVNINGKEQKIELSNNNFLNRVERINISEYVKHGKNTIIFYYPQEEKDKGVRLFVELVGKDE